MTLSWLLYAFVCISVAFLTCFVIVFSFGTVERDIDVKGRAIVILVSNSSIGRMFARNLDKAGFRVSAAHWPPREGTTAMEEEGSSSMEVAQLHMTEDEYQKTMKTFIESHLSLKGMYGLMKKPSILIWEEEEPGTCRLPETKTSSQWKKVLKAPGFWGLVNNAGISTFGKTGWLSMEKYEKFVDVNLLGSIRTTLAFLPFLREYKGEEGWPCRGELETSPSNSRPSKITSMTLSRKIQVCIIQPGNYARSTKIQPPVSAEEIWNELSEEEKAVYNKEYVQEWANFFNSILSEGSTNGHEVVDATVDALTSPAPKACYMVAKLKEKALVFACALFPTAVIDSRKTLVMYIWESK
ncbi:retinol dehydrogenase 7-like [Aegotheles albertisi]